MKKLETKHLLFTLFLCMAFVVIIAFGAFALGGCAGHGSCFGEIFILLFVAFLSLSILVVFLFVALNESDGDNAYIIVTLLMAAVLVGVTGFCFCHPCNPAGNGEKSSIESRPPKAETECLNCDSPDPCRGKDCHSQVDVHIYNHP